MDKVIMNSKKPKARRSNKWPSLRKRFLKGKVCAVCGGKTKLQAHHIIPVHIAPEKELDENNLIALCEGKKTINCHLIVGHGGDFKDYNPYVRKSAKFLYWLLRYKQLKK